MAAGRTVLSCFSDEVTSDLEDDIEDESTWKEIYTDPREDCCNYKAGDEHGMGKNMLKVSATCISDEKEKTVVTGPKRMELNDHKAGMEKLDKEKINKIIFEVSKGSKFYENELKKEARVTERIERQTSQLMRVTEEQKQEALKQANLLINQLEATRDLARTIVHIDMDAFYASVEIRENPSLRNKPMAVGGTGMLSTSNYEARKYGVRAAMPGFIGKKLCPKLIIAPPQFVKYREASHEVREVLAEYDPNFVPMSLDEAYLDLTEYLEERQKNPCKQTFALERRDTLAKSSGSVMSKDSNNPEVETVEFGNDVEDVVREIRFKIEQKTRLTASAGIAPNAMLAKVCSDRNKPDGQFYLKPDRGKVLEFVQNLSIRKISGIGRVTEQMLKALGIEKCEDLYTKRDLLYLLHSQISCRFLLRVSLGLGETRLEGGGPRKSLGTETTFSEINQPREMYSVCGKLCQDVVKSLESEGLKAKTVTVKLKTVTFDVMVRSQSFPNHVTSFEEIFPVARELLCNEIKACHPKPLRLRLMGVRLSSFQSCESSDQNRETKQDKITCFLSRSKQNSKHATSNWESLNSKFLQPCATASCLEKEECNTLAAHLDNTFTVDTSSTAYGIDFPHSNLNPALTFDGRQDNMEWTGCPQRFNPSAASESCLLCPVCGEEQTSCSEEYLVTFNRHVDLCLSKSAIKEMLSKDKELSAEQDLADKKDKDSQVNSRKCCLKTKNLQQNLADKKDKDSQVNSRKCCLKTKNLQQNLVDKKDKDSQVNSRKFCLKTKKRQQNLVDKKDKDSQVNSRKRRKPDSHGSSKKVTLHKFWAK